MKLGLVTYNLAKDWDCSKIIEMCTKTGFEGVELRTTHAHGVEIDLSSQEREAVKERFQDSAIELCGLGSAFEYHSQNLDELRENVEGTKAYAQLAADVGCPGIKVRPNRLPEGVPEEKTLEQIALSIQECADVAADLGVEIRIEVHGKGTAEPVKIRRILEMCDRPTVVACWNSNQNEVVEESVKESFAHLRGQIGLVHMRDICLPAYPWKELLRYLSESGYKGFCCAEIPGNEDPERIMQYYNALFRAYVDNLSTPQ